MELNILISVFIVVYCINMMYFYKIKNIILGMYVTLVFLYSIFPMLGYLFYLPTVKEYTKGQVYNENIFKISVIYTILGMILIFVFQYFWNKTRIKITMVKIKSIKLKLGIFKLFLYVHIYILLKNLVLNFNNLNYQNQDILKNNRIYFFSFEFSTIIFFIYLNNILLKKNKKLNIVFIIDFIIFIITAIKVGQRIQLFNLVIGTLIMFLYYNREKKLKFIKKSIVIMSIFIFLSQVIRGTRGNFELLSENPIEFLKKIILALFDFKIIVFQDWLVPYYSLVTSINFGIIVPFRVIKYNLLVLIPFIERGKSLSIYIREYFAPTSKQGFGYYIFTEAYNVAGIIGIIIYPLILVIYFKVLEEVYKKLSEHNRYLYVGVIGYYIISLVRGGIIFSIKGIMIYLIPALILNNLYYNKLVIKFPVIELLRKYNTQI